MIKTMMIITEGDYMTNINFCKYQNYNIERNNDLQEN